MPYQPQCWATRSNATRHLRIPIGQDNQAEHPASSGNDSVRNPGWKPHSVRPAATPQGLFSSGRPPAQRPDRPVRHPSQPLPPIQPSRPANPVTSSQLRSAQRGMQPTQGQPARSWIPVPRPSHGQSPQRPRRLPPPTHAQPLQKLTPSPPSYRYQVRRVPKQALLFIGRQGSKTRDKVHNYYRLNAFKRQDRAHRHMQNDNHLDA